ncbi:MAG: hypothetical protein ACI83W_001366 [Marinoscillum sp.]|jgi:hypothetical protein
MHYSKLLTLILLIPVSAFAQIDHWESIILSGDNWKYTTPSAQLPTDWNTIEYDDSSWNSGPSGFGYGDGDDATLIPNGTVSIYLRKTFQLDDLEGLEKALLHIDYDDGFVAYLNGTEISRDLVSGEPPSFDQLSDGLHEAVLYQGLIPYEVEVAMALFQVGLNVLSIEVHNESTTSSDMTALGVLSFGLSNSEIKFRPVPDWFPAQNNSKEFTSSTLPIIVIKTEGGRQIMDEPRIKAEMLVLDKGEGQINNLADQVNTSELAYQGKIEIESRGSSSQLLPKKPYGFTTYNDTYSEKDNVSFFGFPEENDWILNSLAFDPSMLRDYLTYNLSRELGEYATKTQYCEVVLNGVYQGLYILQEKIKVDNDRVDIQKMDAQDNQLPDVTGGYIIKSDKTTGGDPVLWTMPNSSGWRDEYLSEHPKGNDITSWQLDYIRTTFFDLASISAADNTSASNGFPSIIDIPSFVDFLLINELASNPDAYTFSTYFHKDRNGKLRAGPIWDINLSYGNDLFALGFDRSHTNIWQMDDGQNSGATFWRDLFKNPKFRCYTSRRWNELIQPEGAFNYNKLTAQIDEIVLQISEAELRDRAAWLREDDFDAEIANMKSWLKTRIEWITRGIGSFSQCDNITTPSLVISKINYHPAEIEGFDDQDLEFIEITNTSDVNVDMTGVYFGGTGLVYQFPVGYTAESNKSIILAKNAELFKSTYGFNPYDEYSRSLSNNGQKIQLLTSFGDVIDEVTYTDEDPWPEEADGEGYYLDLTDLNSDNADPSNWVASMSSLEEPVVLNSNHISSVHTFPNPTTDMLTISSGQQLLNIRLLNLEGKLIKSAKPMTANFDLDMSSLPKGIYILELKTQSEITKKRIEKN